MLTNLKIQNVAIIENIDVSFLNGFNALTGETGAGKSILFDSLGFVLGNRADKTLIRSGQEKAKVTAVFDIKNNINVKTELDKFDITYEDELIISRSMTQEGKNTILLNSQNVTLGCLREVSKYLVDIYGQNEHQILLDPIKQLELLDDFGKNDILSLKNEYLMILRSFRELKSLLSGLGGSEEERLREMDYLAFQIDELQKANLSVDEEEELIQRKKILNNSGKITENLRQASISLDSSFEFLKSAELNLSHAGNFDESLLKNHDELVSAKLDLQEVLNNVNNYLDNNCFDEDEFIKIDERLDVYSAIKRKYGKDTQGVLDNLNNFKERLLILQNLSQRREEVLAKINLTQENLNKVGEELSKRRQVVGENLSIKICKELHTLGIKNAKMGFMFTPKNEFDEYGKDDVQIMFSANLGEPLKPLKAIISGGELSRFMLALKVVAGNSDKMPTMIFDEIDTGISGQMSEIMAQKLFEVSINHQVIIITHSAQLASMSDNHYLIEKLEENGKTISKIRALNDDERVVEIAKFMAGGTNMTYVIQSAKALLEEQNKFKMSFIKNSNFC